MTQEEHHFFNKEIKPALVVINIVLGLFIPATLYFGLLALVIKPFQIYQNSGQHFLWDITWGIGGFGFPCITIASLFITWRLYNKGQYRKAFFASISPIIFALGMLVLLGLIYALETFLMIFE
ncbi:MAG: hypothetical protein MUE81_14400 [Thermoflexibacter sp.]|jgi:hypothetical protein|nr:hypothetical protein [Thermoflexibacter sp.]